MSMGVCSICGSIFEKRTSVHKICSDECREEQKLQSKENRKSDYSIFMRDNFRCVYCGKSPIEDGVKLVTDHVYPKTNGGEHNIYNLITSCSYCNKTKGPTILPKDTYLRIISVIRDRNAGISKKTLIMLNDIFTKRYAENGSKKLYIRDCSDKDRI